MFRAYVSACAIVFGIFTLSGCEEPQTAEDIVASTDSNLPANAAMVAPANWLIVPTSSETPLLLSGTSGPERIVRYNKISGYSLALVNFDCEKGVSVRQIRSAQRDRARMTVDNDPSPDAMGISSHLQTLCSNPESYRRVQGTLGEAVGKMREEARPENAIPEGEDLEVRNPEMEETRQVIKNDDGSESIVTMQPVRNQ